MRINNILIILAVTVIISLLITNFLLTTRNNKIIEENIGLQQEAERVKLTVSQFAIMIIHNVDLGVRSYALFKDKKYLYPLHIATVSKDSLMQVVQEALQAQRYPLAEFKQLRDSINSYVKLNWTFLELLHSGEQAKFIKLADQDKGYHLWLQYEAFARKVGEYEDQIVRDAQLRRASAERLNYTIQLLLFFVCLPTLLITAYYSYKSFSYEAKLRQAMADKAKLLASDNERLEQIVAERTAEIHGKNKTLQTQHEELSAQNEEITAQNEELHRQREELAAQYEALSLNKKAQLDMITSRLHEKAVMIDQLSREVEVLKTLQNVDPAHVQNFNKVLHSTILTEQDWEQFKKTFDEVYPNFFANIRFRFPDITASELRLSALIKLNLTLKEAASTLGISADSVKKSRYRLKKKIGLGEEDSLENFIRGL